MFKLSALPVFFTSTAFLLTSVGLVTACGKSAEEEEAESRSAFLTAYCDKIAKCCEPHVDNFDTSSCRSLMGFSAAGAKFDSAAADACLARMDDGACFETESSSTDEDDPCDKVFETEEDASKGKAAQGEACEEGDDCAPVSGGEAYCDSTYDEAAEKWLGSCKQKRPGKVGDGSCTTYYSLGESPAIIYECESGLYCEPGADVCAERIAIGQECSFGAYGCVEGAYCVSGVNGAVCVAELLEGEVCDVVDSVCATGLYCDGRQADDPRCAKTKADGAACERSPECASDWCENGVCAQFGNSGGGDFGAALGCGLLGGGSSE